MTSKLDIVRAYANELGAGGDIEAAVATFSDDFQNLDRDGRVPVVLAMVEESIRGALNDVDYEPPPSTPDISRWYNTG